MNCNRKKTCVGRCSWGRKKKKLFLPADSSKRKGRISLTICLEGRASAIPTGKGLRSFSEFCTTQKKIQKTKKKKPREKTPGFLVATPPTPLGEPGNGFLVLVGTAGGPGGKKKKQIAGFNWNSPYCSAILWGGGGTNFSFFSKKPLFVFCLASPKTSFFHFFFTGGVRRGGGGGWGGTGEIGFFSSLPGTMLRGLFALLARGEKKKGRAGLGVGPARGNGRPQKNNKKKKKKKKPVCFFCGGKRDCYGANFFFFFSENKECFFFHWFFFKTVFAGCEFFFNI